MTAHFLVLLSLPRIPPIPEPSWGLSATDNAIRIDLLKFADSFFWKALVSSAVVVIGVALEGPELLHELWPKTFVTFAERWVKKVGLIGWLLVVLGVGGEVVFGLLENKAQDLLQTFDEIILVDTQRSAGSAKASAIEAANAASLANSESEKATSSSGEAMALAHGARKEADSFQEEIKSANEAATAAEQGQAAALREATEAQMELYRIRTPRSLINLPKLMGALSQFKGTQYAFVGVFENDESLNLLGQIDSLLTAARWTRVNSPIQSTIELTSSTGIKITPVVKTGLEISVQSSLKDPKALLSTPFAFLPRYIQAALALQQGLASNVNPPDEQLVGKPVNIVPGNSTAVLITIGEK